MSFKYDLTRLKNREQLINFLGINEDTFVNVLTFSPVDNNSQELPLFLRHHIPKKNPQRGFRIVWEPTFLKNDYKTLARRLSNFFAFALDGFPHARTFGYIGGRNIKENAQDHCGHMHLISVDLKDFFPSIRASRIDELFRGTGIAPAVADLLSRFITIERSLPLGLPTSPTVANAVCLPMDTDFTALAAEHEATYSRYADDISFSSDGSLPSLDQISAYVQRHSFEIAESKTRLSRLGQAHYVTGLSISDPNQPHVPRARKRRLRQELFYAEKYGLRDHLHHLGIAHPHYIQHEINRVDGLVKYVAHHEPRLSTYFKTKWSRILQVSGEQPSFQPKNQHRSPFYLYIDEAEYVRPDGGRVLALAIATTQHQDQLNQATQKVLGATLSDLWVAGSPDAIMKRGMHFSDSTEDMRLAYVECLRTLPFEGYVAMARLIRPADYESTYLRLLGAMIKRRLMAAESQFACLVFEKNDKISQEVVRKTVVDSHSSLRNSNNRHPRRCFVMFAGKPNLGLSVPDFLLGVLGKYLSRRPEKEGRPPARDELLFERIRDKYRLILDVDNWIEYSRRRPINRW